jgi:hypothetical protein
VRHTPEITERPLLVPRNDKPLVAISSKRLQRLREHLAAILTDMRNMTGLNSAAAPVRPEPTGFAALVAMSACSLCRGFCCHGGEDDAFLDYRAVAQVWLNSPGISDSELVRLYLDRVPEMVCYDSCIFHGKAGCTLDRSMRSDVCNVYYCGDLSAFMRSGAPHAPTVVIAGEGANMRTSPVLRPQKA